MSEVRSSRPTAGRVEVVGAHSIGVTPARLPHPGGDTQIVQYVGGQWRPIDPADLVAVAGDLRPQVEVVTYVAGEWVSYPELI